MAEPTIKFKGSENEFVNGVPAKSLTTADYDALDTDQRKLVRESPLYDYVTYRDALKPEPDATPVEGTT
jgi:hypothetical protein